MLSHPSHTSLSLRRATTPITGGAAFVAMAALVAFGDLVTKWLAVGLWSGERYPLLGGTIGIEVVHNPLGAYSTSLGPLTREINIIATVAAVLLTMMVCSRLARLDREAPASLGLIAGAGIGNLVSMLGSPSGVPDFLALNDGRGGALVLNVADVAAYIGIACCLRLVWVVVRAAARQGHEELHDGGPGRTRLPTQHAERALRTPNGDVRAAARRSLSQGEV